jgi:hypothetical protein
MYDWDNVQDKQDIELHLISLEEDRYWASIELEEVEYSKTEWEDYYV